MLPREFLRENAGRLLAEMPERFSGTPPGTRAIQLWDSKVPHYFLKTFGRPERVSACECERQHEPSVAQVLHLLNAPEIQDKLSHEGGYLARLARREPADAPACRSSDARARKSAPPPSRLTTMASTSGRRGEPLKRLTRSACAM